MREVEKTKSSGLSIQLTQFHIFLTHLSWRFVTASSFHDALYSESFISKMLTEGLSRYVYTFIFSLILSLTISCIHSQLMHQTHIENIWRAEADHEDSVHDRSWLWRMKLIMRTVCMTDADSEEWSWKSIWDITGDVWGDWCALPSLILISELCMNWTNYL